MATLDHGAVAMLDALGIKKIWRGQNGQYDTSALDTLEGVEKVVRGMVRYAAQSLLPHIRSSGIWNYGDTLPEVKHLAVSDTIVVTATMPKSDRAKRDQRHLDSILVNVVCQCAAYVLRESPGMERPLVYRGAVACGDLMVRGLHYLGPAIDEASENHEQALGAFVWLSPSAEAVAKFHRPHRPHVWEDMAVKYVVPLKTCTRDTIALSPYVDIVWGNSDRLAIRNGMLHAMSDPDPRVIEKRDNTIRFLDHVEARDRASLDAIVQGSGM